MPAMLGTEGSQPKGHNLHTTSGCEVNDCESEGRRAAQNTRKWSSNKNLRLLKATHNHKA